MATTMNEKFALNTEESVENTTKTTKSIFYMPPEIRLMIYDFTFTGTIFTYICEKAPLPTAVQEGQDQTNLQLENDTGLKAEPTMVESNVSLLLTCKQVLNEATPTYFKHAKVTITRIRNRHVPKLAYLLANVQHLMLRDHFFDADLTHPEFPRIKHLIIDSTISSRRRFSYPTEAQVRAAIPTLFNGNIIRDALQNNLLALCGVERMMEDGNLPPRAKVGFTARDFVEVLCQNDDWIEVWCQDYRYSVKTRQLWMRRPQMTARKILDPEG